MSALMQSGSTTAAIILSQCWWSALIYLCHFPQAIILSISHRYTTFHFSDEIIVLARDKAPVRGALAVLREQNRYIRAMSERHSDGGGDDQQN